MKPTYSLIPALALAFVLPLAAGASPKPSSARPGDPKAAKLATPAVAQSTAATSKDNATLDLNTASLAELESVPAIGKTYAQKIVNGRPYKMKSDLRSRKIVPHAVYKKIQDQIVAKQ